MFRGPNKVTLDAKGRFAMPTQYREELMARCNGKVIVTVDKDLCLLIFPLPEWEEVERKLLRLPSMNTAARQLVRIMVGYVTHVEMDANGRIRIKPELREISSLDKNAMLIGQGNKFELWDEKSWKDNTGEWLANASSGDLPPEFDTLSF